MMMFRNVKKNFDTHNILDVEKFRGQKSILVYNAVS